MENRPEKITCIACGSESEKEPWGTKNDYRLVRCRTCGLIEVANPPASTREVYEGADYFSGATQGFGYVEYDADKEPMRAAFNGYLAEVEKRFPKKGRLLDVGAATGFFVALAKERGWDAEGVEISDHAAQTARSRGLKVYTGTLVEVPSSPGSYAVITLFDVIEHVSNPRADLVRVASLLAPGGTVVLITPDAGSLLAKGLRTRWHLVVPPEHLFYFTKKSMRVLLESLGFEVRTVARPGKSFTLRYFFATVARWCPLFPLPQIARYLARHPRLGDLSIPFNTFDNMLIVATKR